MTATEPAAASAAAKATWHFGSHVEAAMPVMRIFAAMMLPFVDGIRADMLNA